VLHMDIDIPEVTVDPTRFIQVLVNLLSNASKYSPMGKEIDLRIQPVNGSCLRIEVADRGPGIPPNERENLFRRFMRLGDQNEAQYGAGLGLSVVKTIIEGHIGEVGVKDRAGGGSIFWFTIPLFNGDFNESVNC
jgi:signal transduction histidine kinase